MPAAAEDRVRDRGVSRAAGSGSDADAVSVSCSIWTTSKAGAAALPLLLLHCISPPRSPDDVDVVPTAADDVDVGL